MIPAKTPRNSVAQPELPISRQLEMPCLVDIPGRPASFRTEMEEESVGVGSRGEGRGGRKEEEGTVLKYLFIEYM